MTIRFLEPAEAEFIEAIIYYDTQSEHLGFEFAAEVKKTITRILQYPYAWTPLSKRIRRCRTKRFPYGIIYQVRGDIILIVAVMHLHQKPLSWKSRLSKNEL